MSITVENYEDGLEVSDLTFDDHADVQAQWDDQPLRDQGQGAKEEDKKVSGTIKGNIKQ
ncbi:hypothetical protein H1R20_g12111, partial [Candolleomyces eurysporus]